MFAIRQWNVCDFMYFNFGKQIKKLTIIIVSGSLGTGTEDANVTLTSAFPILLFSYDRVCYSCDHL